MKRIIYSKEDFAGFTLIELMVVVIIMGIVIALAVPTYTNTKEKALDKEAVMALRLISTANKQYGSKLEYFYPSSGSVSNIGQINNNLSLALGSTNWGYAISGTGATFRANATRVGGTRRWTIDQASVDPACVTACL